MMKEYKVLYKHGQLIEKGTAKRVIPIQDHEYIIIGMEDAFAEEDAKLSIGNQMTESEKAKWVKNEYGDGNFRKIMQDGAKLIFRVGNSRLIAGDENRQYFFICKLLEDLYLYKLKYRDGKKIDDWRLADCQCELSDCLFNGLLLTEKIRAESLNKLFSQTVMFYFSMQRSGSTNVFNTFFVYNPEASHFRKGTALKDHFRLLNSFRHVQ